MSWKKILNKVDIPTFRGNSELIRAESSNAEFLFCTIHSANQLSIYRAVASWCEELAQLIPGQTHVDVEKSVAKANDQLAQKMRTARSGFFGTDTKEG